MNETNDLIVSMLPELREELLGLRTEMCDGFDKLNKRFDKIDAVLDDVDKAFSLKSEKQLGNRT
jgi:hypothetical protein